MHKSSEPNASPWLKTRNWIVGLTAVVVVLPSLINGGIDVYKALLSIPKTNAERANSELFKKYFNKSPVTVFPVPIKYSVGIVEAKFSIYRRRRRVRRVWKLFAMVPLSTGEEGLGAGPHFIRVCTGRDNSAWNWRLSAKRKTGGLHDLPGEKL